ncbi:MAG: fibronectin type III domain-containing protein [Bacteroidetes bacterium]|nr:fibronectin type III domain-containing protein [Bacteroidota bacterium]
MAFTAGADGGSALTSYKYSTDGGTTFFTRAAGTTASPIVIAFASSDGTTALVNGTSYNVQIKAVNVVGDGTASSTTAATPRTTPSAPTITAITLGNGSLSVAFSAGFDGGSALTSYKYSTDGGTTFRTRAAGTTASPIVIAFASSDGTTALVNGTSYNVQIKAVNVAGDGVASSTTAATPRTTPSAPTITAITPSDGSLSVAFTAGADGGAAITSYKYSTDGGTTFFTRASGTTASPLVISTLSTNGSTALANGTSYDVQILAVNVAGDGAASATTAATPRTTPSAPTITAITPGNGSLSVAFTAGFDGGSALTSYKYSTDGGTTFRTRAAGTTASPLVIAFASSDGTTALVNGTSYDVQIKAVNVVGDGTASSTTAATPRTTPSAPTITAITPSDGSLSVAFTAGADGGSALTSYKYSTDGGTTFRTRAAGTTASPIVIAFESSDGTTALANGTSYNVQIKAVNAAGDGAASATTAATPRTTPSAPTITAITPGNASLSVAFTAGATGGSAITSYKYSTDGGTTYRTRASGTTASPLVITTASSDGTTALVNGTSYDIRIKAVNAAGDGAASTTTAATPVATPSAPTITAITPGNASLSVAFSAGADGGLAITSYKYSTDGGTTFRTRAAGTTASPIVVEFASSDGTTALVNGTSYDVQILAVNANGDGDPSSTTAATPRTTPSAPTITAITPSNGSLSVAFSAGFNGGSALTSYKYSTDGGTTFRTRAAGTTASPLVISTASSDGTTALVNGTSYNIQIKAVNVVGDGVASSTTAATPRTTPSAPTITAITPSNGSLSVAFTAGFDGGSALTSYRYSTDGGTTFRTRAAGTTASPIVIAFESSDGTTALANGTSYDIQIRAVNIAGDGAASSTTAATPRTTPSAPTITAITPSNGSLSVAFTAGFDGGSALTSYKYSTDGGTTFRTRATGTTASPIVIAFESSDGTTALVNGTSYDIQIKAVNVVGDGAASSTTAATPATTPSAPTITAITPSNATLSVAFTAGATGGSAITNYEYSTDGGTTFKSRATGTTASPIVITTVSSGSGTLVNGTSYDVQIRAINAIGNGAASSTTAATPATTPSAPTITAITPSNATLSVAFTAGATGGSAITNYEYSTDGGTTFKSRATGTTASPIVITTVSSGSGTLVNGTSYDIQIRAINAIGNGAASSTTAATPATTPSAPTITAITPSNATLSVAFTAGATGGSAITNYEYSTDGGTTFKSRATGTTASPIVLTTVSSGSGALVNGTSYDVQIRAINAIGNGAASSTTAATPRTTPSAPTITAITPSNGSLSVAFSAGADGGSAITSYKYSTDGGTTFRTRAAGTTASPIVIAFESSDGTTALANGTSYDVQIKAVNVAGDGAASSTTAATPRTTPSAPTITAITPSNGSLSVAFSAGFDGGSAITSYKYSTDGGTTFRTRAAGTTASPIVIAFESSDGTTALVNGSSYDVQIKAVNVVGDGLASSTTAATPRTTPSAPTITAITPSSGSLSVAFSAGADGGSAITSYKYSTDGGTTFRTRAAGTTASPLVIAFESSDGTTALANGTSYNVQIKAVNAAGDGTASSTTAATPRTTPGAPTSVSGTAGNAQVSLTWTAPASNGGSAITDYVVEFDDGSGFATFDDGVSATAAATVTGLANGTSHTFRVSAVNAAGTGAASVVSGAVIPRTTPSAPTITAITPSNGSLSVAFTAGFDGGSALTSYKYSTDGGTTFRTRAAGTTASPLVIAFESSDGTTALANGTSYNIQIKAVNVIGDGVASSTTAATPRTTPSAPTITAITPSDGALSVAFTAGFDGGSAITSYKYSTDGGTTFRTRAAGTTASPIVIAFASSDGTTALVNGTSYNIQIKAVNVAGDGAASSTTAATPVTVPSAPTITAITPSNGSLSVAFTAGANGGSAITSYKYSTDGGTTFRTRAAGTTASPLVIDFASSDGTTALANGTSYNVQIKAVNAVGDGAASSTTAATPRTTPSAPTITAITPGDGSLSVAFSAGFNGGSAITSYKYSTDGGTTFRTRAAGTTASPIVITTASSDGTTALVNGTSYNIQIKAVNVAGDGAASSTTAATPVAVPSAPTITAITPSSASLSVAFSAGFDGGSAITSYKYSTDGGTTFRTRAAGTTASPIVIAFESVDGTTALVNGTSYNVQILAVNANGDGAASATTAATPRTTPGAPTDVSGTTGNAQVSLTWTAPASTGGSPITDYVVEFNGGSGFATFADGTSATAAATVTGLTNGTSYTFRVSAVNAAGTGGASDVSAAVIPRTTPGPPTSVSGTSGNTEVLLTWTAPSNGGSAITDYVIQSSPDGSIWTTFADGTSTSTSATVTGLTNGQAYTFRVAASNIAGTGNFSSASSSVTPATVPSAPTITAITPSDGSLSVAFTAGANGGSAITSYKYSTDGGTTFRTRAAGTTASPLVIDFASSDGTTALANGTSYNVQIKAVNAVGDSAASSTTAATPRTTSSAPTITAITPSDGALSVAFTAGADGGSAITSYKYSTDGGTTFRTRAAGTTASPLVIAFASSDGTTALVNGTSYDIQIKAVNAAGDGAASSTTAATPRTTPSAPTITAITPSSGSLSVAFTAGADGGSAITSYKYSTDGGTTFRTRAAGTTASPLVIAFASSDGTTALVNGTSYNVQIKAVNAVGDGAASATTAATPAAVPSAPTITAITPTDGSLSVAFSAGATGGSAITNYEYSTDGGTTFKSRATGTTASPLVITTVSGSASALVNGTSYDVQIRAINSIGNGAASSSTAATPRTTPSAPTITAITPSDGALSVAFTAGADGGSAITSYKYSTDGGTTFRTRAAGTTASPLVIAFASSDGTTALVNGTSYNVQIKAVNVAGDGAASSTTAATPASTPSAPTITLITPSDGSLSVAFTAPASNGGSAITSYKYSTDGGTTFRTRAAGTTASPLVIAFASSDGTTALVNGTSYNVQIKAVNAAGDGTASSTTAATPSTVPGVPTNVVGTSGNTQVSLTWTAPNDGGNPITDYVVEINDGSGFATFADGTSTSTSATVTGLTNGTSYTFRVSATNSAGTSSVSTVSAAVIPATVPNAPTGLTGESGAARVALNWTAPAVTGGSAITDYIIEFNDGSGFATFADGISTATAMSVTGLTNGAPYTFRVSAVNSVGTGATSNVAGPVTPFDAPGAPTGVSGTPLNTSVALSWTAPTSNGGSAITNYVIESSTNGTTWIPFSHAPSVATSATVTGLTNGTAYTFRVSATNNIGTGATSAVSAAVTPRTIPGVPTSVSGTSENSQVSLTWTAPSDGGSPITDYVVEVSENGASFVTFADGTSATAAATVTGLTNGTSYTFRVSATNAAGTSAPSTVSASVTPLSTPGAPTGVSGTPGNGQVPLTWSAPASTGGTAITDYVVEFNSGGSWSTFADGVSTATNATVTGLTNGTAYTFRVSATNSVGTGAAGVSAAVTPRTVPSAPTGVSGTAGDTQVALTWTAPASDGGNAITDYVVESSTNGTDWTVFADGTSTTTSATVTGLTNDTAYTFRVSATNVAGTGASGVSAAVTPRAKPGAPTGVAGTGSDGQVALTWTAPASDGGSAIIDYVVESSTNGTDWTVFADGTSTATSATVTGLSNGTSYTFRVSATSSIGTGAPSAASAAVTPASVPGAPSGVSGTAGDARVFLSWTAPSNGGSAITDYVVEVSSGGSYSVFADGTSSATSATVTGLSNGTAYTFRVSATNGIGTGATSTASAAVTPAQPPAATASLSLSEGNDSLTGTVSVVTNGSIVSAIDYEVDGSGTWVSTGLTASGDFTISGLVNGTSYSVVLRVTSSGTGSPTVSAAATGTPAVPPTTTTTTTTIAPPDTTPVTTTTTTTTIAPPNAQPSTTTTTIAPPETIPPTTSTTIPQPEPATSTTVPATTTTTTTVPLFITPTVITANDGATIMQMDVPQSSGLPDASQTVVAVVVPPEANTENLVWNMMMSDRVQQTTIDEGYMTIEVTANMQSGESVTTMDAPIEIMLPAPPPDGVLAYSRDGITWTLIPQLLVPTLPEGQPDGYWIEPDGTITLITRHLTGFGIRKPQAPLELEVAKIDIVSGSVSRALATGGTSEDPIRYQTTSDESVCRVTDSGLIYGMSAGVCTVYATRGGGSIYLDTSSTTFSATVVSSITPIVPPVANLPLILQILALIALCVLLGFLGNRAWLTISDYRSNSTKL